MSKVSGNPYTLRHLLAILALAYLAPLMAALADHYTEAPMATDWRTARRDSAGIAPNPSRAPEAVVQVYAARAFRWRGAFAVHTWIAAKPQRAAAYTRFEVIGFGLRQGLDAVRVHAGTPDVYWYGSRPVLLAEFRGGDEVDRLIARLRQASADYPYHREYHVWPGPNSNTFTAYLGRIAPELGLDLPPTAIGKDFLPAGALLGRPASGRGVQLSLAGLAGLIVSPEEGVEVNLLGLTLGLDLSPPALKLPGLGRLEP